MQSEKTTEQLRAEHRAFGTSKPCAFLGFDNDKPLEDKIYNFIDEKGKDWDWAFDAWDPLIDFFKAEQINNVSFSGQSGLMFNKIF